MTDLLTVISVVEHDPGLVDLMIKSVLKFTKPHPKFIFCDNANGKNEERIKRAMGSHKLYKIIKHDPSLRGGSNRHGQGLDKIIPMVETKYTAIIESDVAVLSDCWWKIDHSKKYKAKGAIKEVNTEQLYHACFFIFETDKLQGMSFMPNDPADNKSYKPKNDVGNKIKNKIRWDDIEPLTFVDCKSGRGKYFDSSFQSDEFHDSNGNVLAVHLGRGSNLGGKTIRKHLKHPADQLIEWKKIVSNLIGE